jgi:hypothetical protein
VPHDVVTAMWPYAIPFCVVRIAEMRPVLIAVALHRDFDMAKAGALRVVDCGLSLLAQFFWSS